MPLPKSAPRRVGRYRLLAPIARGGAATVYLGRSEGIGGFKRIVAVKLLHPHLLEDAASQASNEFIEEAKLSARMQHPMIVPVMDVGQSEEGFYLVMDYVDGASLSEILRKSSPIPQGIALRILYDALQGLQAAHTSKDDRGKDLGIVHRDFSPQNILVGTDGRSRLTDFGIARATTRAEYTRTGLVKGKVAYMSPEQAEGKPLDARTDVWAAGVVAWEMFAGQRMYPKMDPMPMMLKIINDPPPRLKKVQPDAPQALDDALARALHPELKSRTETALELRNSIVAAMGGESKMASPEEVGTFVSELNIERLDELRAIIQETSESQSVSPPEGVSGTAPKEGTTRVEMTPSATAESGTFATTSAEMRASGQTVEVVRGPSNPNGRLKMIGGAIALAAVAAAALLTLISDPREDRSGSPTARNLAAAEVKATPTAKANEPADGEVGEEDGDAPDQAENGEVPSPDMPEPEPRSEIVIRSEEPFQSLKVGTRSIVLPSPENTVTVRLLDSERQGALTIEAVTQDGRQAKAELGAEDADLDLEFPKTRPRTIQRPATKKTTKPKSDLAASPYQ